MPPEHSSQEAFAAARTALLKADATPLFWCERRDCGSSSLLANAVFGNAKLYGPDEQQAYLLVRLAAPQENSLVAVYSITRGNRRAYLQAEELKADAPLAELLPSPATLLRLLKANGELTLSHVPAEPAGSWLARWCGPCAWIPGCGSSLSGKHAQEWRDALRGQGVLNSRMGWASRRSRACTSTGCVERVRPGLRARAMAKMPSARPPARVDCLSPAPHAPAGNGARRALSIGVSPFEEGLP